MGNVWVHNFHAAIPLSHPFFGRQDGGSIVWLYHASASAYSSLPHARAIAISWESDWEVTAPVLLLSRVDISSMEKALSIVPPEKYRRRLDSPSRMFAS